LRAAVQTRERPAGIPPVMTTIEAEHAELQLAQMKKAM
jgi:hypothetical protein